MCRRAYGFLVVLDGILDPQNLGSLIRTATCAGFTASYSQRIIGPISQATAKAPSGTIEYTPVWRHEYCIYTQEIEGCRFGQWRRVDSGSLGNFNEVIMFSYWGLRKRYKAAGKGKPDHLLSIPMFGNISSFNVSVWRDLHVGNHASTQSRQSLQPARVWTQACPSLLCSTCRRNPT
jgi:23S rRNA (guanosine2251-2'-O)-methyltransferase